MAQMTGKKSSDFAAFGWVEWTLFWGPVWLTWLGTILAFLDQTMGRLREKDEGETEFLRRMEESKFRGDK